MLPAITPSNCRKFMTVFSDLRFCSIEFWSLCSGGSRLEYCLDLLNAVVLFPVDLRYGWNLSDKSHQDLLLEVHALFQPSIVHLSPRCKFWNRGTSRKYFSTTKEMRKAEKPMHLFVGMLFQVRLESLQDVLCVAPRSSLYFHETPIAWLWKHESFKAFSGHTAMCAFTEREDGERIEKGTNLRSTFLS